MPSIGQYGHVDRIIAMQDFGWPLSRTDRRAEDWRQIPTACLTNPFEVFDWRRLHPLRLSVIGKTKVGVAENPSQFRFLMKELGTPSVGPYELDKKVHEEFIPKFKPKSAIKNNPFRLANEEQRED